MISLTNQVVKGYELKEVLGEGGFGAVYRAYQPLVKREVAIKVILPTYANQPEFVRRFETEAQIVAQLEHPYIVPLYDFWRDPSGAYLVMRMLRGGSLEDSIAKAPWTIDATLRLVDQISTALSVAHQSNIVHADLKPANILLDKDQNAFLSDFGIASTNLQTESGAPEIAGTPAYAAPEQLRGIEISPQTDIYSLALVIFEVLTGQKAFEAPNISAYIIKQLTEPTPSIHKLNPNLPRALDDVIHTATAKAPEARFSDVIAFARAFRQALQETKPTESISISLDDEDMDDLIKIDGSGKGFVLTADAIDLEALDMELVNPYKGLRAFQQGDAKDFFGREALTQRLIDRMSETEGAYRFLAVVGPSGSGKSSVVKAGLIPALRRGAVPGSNKFFISEMVPSNDAMRELEGSLLGIATHPPENFSERLRANEFGLHTLLKEILPDDGSELLLLIDQFEEIYTLTSDNAVRVHFMDSLREALTAPDSRLRAVITIRADFYDKPLLYPEFGYLIRERTEVVLPLTVDELESTIVGPATRTGVRVEEALVEKIITDVKAEPGALPLLQYALTESFERRTGYVMTLESYLASGGVLGSLARRAEELYNQMNAEQQEAVRQLFLRLVTLGEGTEDTRRRILWSELVFTRDVDDPLQIVVDTYSKYRLLTTDADPQTREPTVEVAHEALIRQWKRLRGWLQNSREDLRTQRRLNAALTDWRNANRDSSFLASGVRLQQFETLVENADLALTAEEIEYVRESVNKREAQRLEEEARKAKELELERRAKRVFQILVGVFAVAAVIAIGLAGFAFTQQQEAQRQRAEAEAQRIVADEQRVVAEEQRAIAERETDITLSLSLAQQARQNARNGDTPFQGIALAVEANRIENPPAQAQLTLANLIYAPGALRSVEDGTIVFMSRFTPDGTQMMTADVTGVVAQWDVQSGRLIRRFGENGAGHNGKLAFAVTVSPDGSTALSGAQAGEIILWDMATGEALNTLNTARRGHLDSVWDIAYTPDGEMAVAVSNDSTPNNNVLLWNLETGEIVRRYEGHTGSVYSVDLSPDGETFVTASGDSTIRLWSLETGEIVRRYEGHTKTVYGARFTPDGSRIISAGDDGKIFIWDTETGEAIQEIDGAAGFMRGVAVSPDGQTFSTADVDNAGVTVWDANSGTQIDTFLGQSGYVVGVAYSPDGKLIASGGADGAFLWDVYGRDVQLHRLSAGTPVLSAALSPDSASTLAGTEDGRLILYNTATGETIREFAASAPLGTVYSVIFNTDGSRAVSASENGAVVLWDVETGEEIRRYEGLNVPVRAVTLSADGSRVAAGGGNVQVSRDRVLDNSIVVWDAESGETVHRFEGHSAPVRSLAFSADNTRLLSGSDDVTLMLWDVATGESIRTYPADTPTTNRIEGHANSVLSVAFNSDGTQIVSAGRDARVLVWNTETGEVVTPLLGHSEAVHRALFSPDATQVLSASGNAGGSDTTVILWDLAQAEPVRRYQGHSAPVRAIAYNSDGTNSLSVSDDGQMIVWRIDSLEYLTDYVYNRYEVLCLDTASGFNDRLGENSLCQTVAGQDEGEITVVASVPPMEAPESTSPVCMVDTPAEFTLTSDTVDTSAFQREGPYTLGLASANSADPRSAYTSAWVQYTASQQDSIEEVVARDAGGSFDTQVEQINELIEAGVDAIIVEPVEQTNMEPLTEALAAAREANIAVVLVSRRVDTDAYVSYVGVNDYEIGCIMAQELVAAMDGEGPYLQLNGADGTLSDNWRKAGANAIRVLYPAMTQLAENAVGVDDSAQPNVNDLVSSRPQLRGVWAYNGLIARFAQLARQEAGSSLVPIVGDQDAMLAQLIAENGVPGALVRIPTNAIGTSAVETALSILGGEEVASWVSVPVEVLDTDALTAMDVDPDAGLVGDAEGLPDSFKPEF